jgi:hypothetical protein
MILFRTISSLKRTILPVSLLFLMALAPGQSFAAPARGSVKLSRTSLRKIDKFYCGKRGNAWLPGKYKAGYFLSHKAEVTNLRNALKKANAKSKAKIKAQIASLTALNNARTPLCKNGGSSGSGGSTQLAGLRFNFSGAKALAMSDSMMAAATFGDGDSYSVLSANQAESNLRKVVEGGGLAPVVASGKADVSRFIVAPNNKLYLIFKNPCLNSSCSQRCLLAEVDTTSGSPVCVENKLQALMWDQGAVNGAPSTKPIQFDNQGSLYYLGYGENSKTVLRKYTPGSGTLEDLINENISIRNFLVLADGSVLLAGYTQTSQLYWLRRRNPNGSISVIAPQLNVGWMAIFPDGRVYVADWSAIYRMEQNGEALSPVKWMTDVYSPNTTAFNRMKVGASWYQGTSLHNYDGSTYGLIGSSPNPRLLNLFPVPNSIETSVTQITGVKPILSNLLVHGTDGSGYGKLIIYNLERGTETDLLGSNKMEVYRVEYLAGDNAVQFDGQRFSDGKYVICTVYLSDGNALACAPTGSVKLADFQSFSYPGVRIPPPPTSPTPIPLIEYDLAGASALWGASKIKADGSVVSAIKSSKDRLLPIVDSDNGQLWMRHSSNSTVKSSYLSDTEASRCSLAKISSSGGKPTCVFTSDTDSIELIRSRADGAAYFLTRNIATQVYKLYFYPGSGSTSSMIDSWAPSTYYLSISDAIITESGSLLVASNNWIKNIASNGEKLLDSVNPTYSDPKLAKLADGRILATEVNGAVRSLDPSGLEINTQRYSYYNDPNSSNPYDGEVECLGGVYDCMARSTLKILSLGSQLFSISNAGLLKLANGPVAPISLSNPITPSFGAALGGVIYLAGRSSGEGHRVSSYNVVTGLEQDLTDDPELAPSSLEVTPGKVLILGTKPRPTNQYPTCDNYLAVKTIGGGTSVEKLGPCDGDLQGAPLVKLVG